MDVQRTRDGKLILLHDERADRTTDGRGPVAEMSIELARTLQTRDGEQMPTLEQALHAANDRIGLVLELKVKGIAEQSYAAVRHSRFGSPLIYASFAAEEMRAIRAADASAMTMVLMDTLPQNPVAHILSVEATHAGLRFTTVTRPLIEAFHGAGVHIFAYTVNELEDIRKMRAFGVDGIISDFPDRI